MASDKSKLAKLNLKTSLYFAGSITFGTVAVGAAISIPVYLEIKKSLAAAIEKFSNLSQYLSQLAQKLGIPADSEFEQELANGYIAVHSGEGTQVFKEVNGQKVLVMNTKPDGTVQTAASFEGVEALTMLTAIDSAKEAFDNEAEAMQSILEQYSEAIDDSSYLTEALTTSQPVAILVLRDKLADFDIKDLDIKNLSDVQKAKAIDEANEILKPKDGKPGIATRNGLTPDHVDDNDIATALRMLGEQRNLATLDQAKASNKITDDQQRELDTKKQEQEVALVKAQKDLADIKQKQAESAAQAAQKAAEVTQTKVVEKAAADPVANASFIFSNTSTFQKWFALLGATFGNIKGNGLEDHAPSILLREPIKNQLEKNDLKEDRFLKLKDSLLEMIGVDLNGADWAKYNTRATKKIMTVTQIMNTFTNTKEDARIIVYDIKVNNILGNKIEDYFILARPEGTKLTYNFKDYTVQSEDMGAYKGNKQLFEDFVQTLAQISLMTTSKTLQSLNETAFTKIQKMLDELEKKSNADISKIKLTSNKNLRTKLEDFIRNYANNPSTAGIYQDFALMLFNSNFNIGGKDIDFDPKYLDELIKLLIEKDGYIPSSNAKPEEIYLGYESQKLLGYIKNNFETFGNYDSIDKENILDVFKNNWASFDAIGISNEIKTTSPELMFDKDVVKLIPSSDKTELHDLKEVIGTFGKEVVTLLKKNPTDLKPYIRNMKFIKELQLSDSQIDMFRNSLLDDKLLSKFDELYSIASKQGTIPSTQATYKDGTADYIKNETVALVAQLNANAQLQTIIEHYNWVKTLGLDDVQYGKLKLSLFDANTFTKWSEVISVSNIAGDIPNTSVSYKDGTTQFIINNLDLFIKNLSAQNSKQQTFIENYNWVKNVLTLDNATFAKINDLLLDEKYFGTWASIITLSNDKTWKPQDNTGKDGLAIDAIKKYFNSETQTLIDQFNKNVDIVAIKESMRYTFKGVSVSNPTTQARIDAAKDVAKDLDNIKNLDDVSKASIQSSVEQVITSQDTQTLTSDEFDTIMKYTQTVFKLFPTPADATKQLQKVLEPTQLVANNKAIVKNIATLNTWVEEIAKTNPNTTITLAMIKDYAWKDGVVSTKYVNGKASVDVVKSQSGNDLLLAGAQITSSGKIMTIGSFMWGLWELEHASKALETKITPIGAAQTTQINGGWASSPYYNDQDMYAIPLVINNTKSIYKYDENGNEIKISVDAKFASKETRSVVVIDVGSRKIAYGFSNDGYFDEYDITDTSKPAPQTHVDYSTIPELDKWKPTWTATAFEMAGENYIAVPLSQPDTHEFGMSIWHAETSGHLKFVNLAKFSSATNQGIAASIAVDPTSTSGTLLNSGVWSNAVVAGEITGDKAILFLLDGSGKLWNLNFKSLATTNNQFVIDDAISGTIIDSATILPQIDANNVAIKNPWRGMTYNPQTHEINIFGKNGAIYIPNQNQKIADIYDKLLT